MKRREPVSHIMTTGVLSVEEHQPLSAAIDIFRTHKIRHLPVVKGNEVSGILSSSDINRLTFGKLFENQDGADAAIIEMLTIPQVMTHHVKSVPSDTTIRDVAQLFAEGDYHSLPVVDEGQLKGIVTTTDIMKYILEQY